MATREPGGPMATAIGPGMRYWSSVHVALDEVGLGEKPGDASRLGLSLRDLSSGAIAEPAGVDALVIGKDGNPKGAYFGVSELPVGAPQVEVVLVDRATERELASKPLAPAQGEETGAQPGLTPSHPFTGTLQTWTDKENYRPGERVIVHVRPPRGWDRLPGFEAGGLLTVEGPEGPATMWVTPGTEEVAMGFTDPWPGMKRARVELTPPARADWADPAYGNVRNQALRALGQRQEDVNERLSRLQALLESEADLFVLPDGTGLSGEALGYFLHRLEQDRGRLQEALQLLGR